MFSMVCARDERANLYFERCSQLAKKKLTKRPMQRA
jgi:hypothetical protein